MTKPVGYFVSGEAIDLLIGIYGDHLQKLSRFQQIHLLFLIAEVLLSSYDDEDEPVDASDAFGLVEYAISASDDIALGLIEAIVSQLRYPLQVAQ